MGESLVEAPKVDNKMGGESYTPCLQESVSFGRFEHDSLCWERWSTFPSNKYLEEVEKCSTPGSVAQKKAYFEAHYKRIAARKAELLDQESKREAELNSGDRSPLSSICNNSEEELLDVEKSSTQNSVDGSELLNDVGEFTGEMSDKHVDIVGHSAEVMIEEDGVADLTSEVSEHIDELSDDVDVIDEVSEGADLTVEVSEHVDELNDDEVDLAIEEKDMQPEHIEELTNGDYMIRENRDIQPEHIDEASVTEEKRDIQPENIVELNIAADMIKENKDIQPQLEGANEDVCLKMEIPHLEEPGKLVSVIEDTASARVWQDKEVLPQEKVEERKIAKKETKNPVKLVDPMKTKKTTLVKKTTDIATSKKKPASPFPKRPAASTPKSPMLSTPKSSKSELTKTAKTTARPSVKKENGCTPLTSKKEIRPESKRVLSTSMNMSLSYGPANSDPASLTGMRKSLIMERMGDKDIVKRAFKAFQNVGQISPSSVSKTETNKLATKRIEPKASAPDTLQKKKEGRATNPVTGQQGTKKTLESPGLKKNIGVDQRNGKAVPSSLASRNGKSVSASFGSRSLDQGRQEREVPKKLDPRTSTKDAGKTLLQSKLKAKKATEIGKATQSINSKSKLSSSYNQGHGFLRGSVRKDNTKI